MQKQYPDSYLGEDEMADVRKHMIFHGRVQGVGFRYTAKYLARSMNLTGWVKNEYDGTVVMEVQGREAMIFELMKGLNRNQFIQIDWIDTEEKETETESSFEVKYYVYRTGTVIRYIHLKDTYVILEVFKMRVDKEKKNDDRN